MKGKISPELETVLRDPQARTQLRKILTSGHPGVVTVGETKYKVSTVVVSPEAGAPAAPDIRRPISGG